MLREMQEIKVEGGGYKITIPNDPAWHWQIKQINNRPMFITWTPELYYPPISMSITSYHDLKIDDEKKLRTIAVSALEIAAKNYRSTDFDAVRVKQAGYASLSGYETHFTGNADNKPVAVRAFVGSTPQQHLISLQAYTQKQTQTAMQRPVNIIWDSIQFQNTSAH